MPNETPGPYSIGSDHWPGLSKLIEECGEVIQVAGKLLGAGGEVEHWDGTNLRDRMASELGDLLAAIQFFGSMNDIDSERLAARMEQKVELYCEWHEAGLATTVEP